jgi:hypothetical protein
MRRAGAHLTCVWCFGGAGGLSQLECWLGDGGDDDAGHQITLPSLSSGDPTKELTPPSPSVLLLDYAVGSLRLRNTGAGALPLLGLLELRAPPPPCERVRFP